MIEWEWDVETTDEDGINHNFCKNIEDLIHYVSHFKREQLDYKIVLVHSTITALEGLTDRSWAYIQKNGQLPEFTSKPNSDDEYLVKYRRQIEKFWEYYHNLKEN
jgi:hypothetical protein